MTDSPKISIGITTYNRPEFLREAVASVVTQSFEDFELIISNDYLAVPVNWDSLGMESDARVRIVNQAVNLGEADNMNFLLGEAQGEWFVWLADDDLLHPEFLSIAQRAIAHYWDEMPAGFYPSFVAAVSPSGIFPGELRQAECKLYDAPHFLHNYSSRKIALVGTYGLLRTSLLRKFGGIMRLGNSFGPYCDNLLPMMLVGQGKLVCLDVPLVFLRTHPESMSCMSTELSAFTSAEDDFLDYLGSICADGRSRIDSQKITANMIKWFADNELAVLLRDRGLRLRQVFGRFFSYQVRYHLPRLSMKYKFGHVAYVISLAANRLTREIWLRMRDTR
jgi:glycosyltransferase involved in cell wall biosynthesis